MKLIDVTATITFRTKIAVPSDSSSQCHRIPSKAQVKASPTSVTLKNSQYHRVAPPPPVTTSLQKIQSHSTRSPQPRRPAPPLPNTKPPKRHHRAAPPPPMYTSADKKDSRKKSSRPNRPAPPPPVTLTPLYHRSAPPPPIPTPPRRLRNQNAPTPSVTAASLHYHNNNDTQLPPSHKTLPTGAKKQRRSRITPAKFLNTKRNCSTIVSAPTVTLSPSHNQQSPTTQHYTCSLPRPSITTTALPSSTSSATCIRHRVMVHHSDEIQPKSQNPTYLAQDHQYTSAKPPLSIPVRLKVNKKSKCLNSQQ